MKNFGRRKGNAESNRRSKDSSKQGSRVGLSRWLRAEQLEQRQLLAGDVEVSPHQNSWAAKDVNNDLRITPMDALVVLNELNRNGSRELANEPVQESKFVDVNGDNRISSLDALQVINALNRGSGEDVPIVELLLDLTDDDGNSLVDPETREADLSLDQIVNLEVQYTDARLFGNGLGLFTVYTDLLVDQTGILEPLVTETQVLTLSENFVDSTGGSVTISQSGMEHIIPFGTIAADPAGAIRSALIDNFGYTEDQILTTLETREPRDPANGRPEGDPFDIYIRFVGDEFVDVDVPNFSIDASGLTTNNGVPVEGSDRQIDPKLPDGSINPEAVGFSLDPRSRTANGQSIYTNVRSGSFNDDPNDAIADGFLEIGATGQLNAGGLPAIVSGTYIPSNPFEAFSIRVRVTEVAEDLDIEIQVPLEDEANPNESVLVIYGNRPDGTSGDERGLSPAEYILDEESKVKINVTAAVTARGDDLNTDEDTSGTVDVLQNDSNAGSGELTIISVTNGSNGTVTFNGPNVTYTPADDYFGPDQFTYTVENGDGDQGTGTVTVNVASVNDPPTADDFSISVTEGNTRELANSEFISRSDAGPANENQTPVVDSITDAVQGSAVLNQDGSVTYVAPTGYEGPDSFTYTISDGIDTVTATVSITVLDQNDPPVANDDTIDGVEDTPITFTEAEFNAAVLANDTPGPQNEIDNGQVVTLVSVDATGSAGGTWSDNNDGTFTYTPPQDVFGTPAETFEYVITDGEFNATGTITINLDPVNDRPIANDDDLMVDELTSNNMLMVLSNDSAGPFEDSTQSISVVQVVDGATNGVATVSADGLSVLYTPNIDYTGPDSFTYTISDGELISETATVTIDVVPVIRPRARDNSYDNILEDSGTTTLDVTADDLPNEGFDVTLESIGSIPASQGTLAINGNSIDFTPADDFFGSVSFTYTISDTSDPVIDDPDEIAAATGTVNIEVQPVNDPPVFVADDPVSGIEDTPLSINGSELLENDGTGADNEDDTLTIVGVAGQSAEGGSVTLDGSTFTYSPADNYNSAIVLEDTFTYTISDGTDTVEGTVTLSIDPVNDPPELDLNDLVVSEDIEVIFGQSAILGNSLPGPATATDEANQTLEIVSVGSSMQGGSVAMDNGSIVYKGPQDFFGTDMFPVTVRDSLGAETTGTVTIVVEGVNDPPELGDPSLLAFSQSVAVFTSEDLLESSNVGPGETGLPGQVLSVVNVVPTGNTTGSIQFNSTTGEVTYTPQEGFTGEDELEITISDGSLTTTGLVTVTVQEFEPSVVSGSVFFDFVESIQNPVRNGVQDPHEPGLEMAQVRLISGADENVTGSAIEHTLMTDRTGAFEFTNVPPGTYHLRFDMPLMVWDGADVFGTLGDSDSVENQFTFDISEPGGLSATDYNFTLLSFNGRAGNAMDSLISNYMASNPDVALASQNGLLGAKAYVDANGNSRWFSSKAGLEGTIFGEINLDQSGTIATLSVIMEDGSVLTGIVPQNQVVILEDTENGGHVVQIFGSLESFGLQPDGSINPSELGLMAYQASLDMMLAQDGNVL